MRRTTTLKMDAAVNGIAKGDHVSWKTKGYPRSFGDVAYIYLSFKYPRGFKLFAEPTIKVATMVVIRDRWGNQHHVCQTRVVKEEPRGTP